MALGLHFGIYDSLCAPLTVLPFSLGFYVEMLHKGLDITLVPDGQKFSLEVLSEGKILVVVSLAWYINAYSTG